VWSFRTGLVTGLTLLLSPDKQHKSTEGLYLVHYCSQLLKYVHILLIIVKCDQITILTTHKKFWHPITGRRYRQTDEMSNNVAIRPQMIITGINPVYIFLRLLFILSNVTKLQHSLHMRTWYLVVWRDVQVDEMFKKRFSRAVVGEESVAVNVVKITASRIWSPTSQRRKISHVKTQQVIQPLLNGVTVSVPDGVGQSHLWDYTTCDITITFIKCSIVINTSRYHHHCNCHSHHHHHHTLLSSVLMSL